MSSLNKNTFFKSLMFYFPTLILFISVLNEIDLNYLAIDNPSISKETEFKIDENLKTKYNTAIRSFLFLPFLFSPILF